MKFWQRNQKSFCNIFIYMLFEKATIMLKYRRLTASYSLYITTLEKCWIMQENVNLLTISVHRGQDNIIQAPFSNGFGGVRRLLRIQRWRTSCRFDCTEPATSGTRIPHELEQEKGRCLFSKVVSIDTLEKRPQSHQRRVTIHLTPWSTSPFPVAPDDKYGIRLCFLSLLCEESGTLLPFQWLHSLLVFWQPGWTFDWLYCPAVFRWGQVSCQVHTEHP